MACKKCTRKTPKRQIFEISTSVPNMVVSQGDTKLDKQLAQPEKSWIWH